MDIEALIPDDYEETEELLSESYDAWLDETLDIESFLDEQYVYDSLDDIPY